MAGSYNKDKFVSLTEPMKYLMIILLSFLIATLVSVVGIFVLQSLDLVAKADTDLKNLPYGIAVAFNLFLALGTLPIFFNLKNVVKSSLIWSAISFFLLPLLVMACLALSLEEEALTGVAFCIPYFIVLIVQFVRFRR